MKLENQVCTLAQAKRLKELVVAQIGLFCFNHPKESYIPNWREDPCYKVKIIKGDVYGGWSGYEYYSAYTVAELGVMLPFKIKAVHPRDTENSFEICFYVEGKDYMVAYENHGMHHSNGTLHSVQEDTESQARAAMLIYLLENGHTTAEEVNQRLINN